MASSVSVTFVGDDASLAKRIEKQQDAIKRLTQDLRNMKREGTSSTAQVSGGLAEGTRNAMAFAAGLAGVGTAAAAIMGVVRQLKAEYEILRERQSRAAGAQISVAEAKSLSALQRPQELPRERLEGMVDRITATSGMTRADIWKALPEPLSAMGSATPEQFESAMTLGARIRARAGEGFEMGPFVGGTLDILRSTGVKTGEEALGFTRQFGMASRMVDVQHQVRALAPAVTAGLALGATPEESAELTAFISQRIADPEGRLSSTAAINFMFGISKEIIPRYKTIGGRVRKSYEQPAGSTYPERLKSVQDYYAQASEVERLDLLTKIPGRAKTRGAIMGLLGRDPGAMRELATAQGRIGAPGGQAQLDLTAGLMSEIERGGAQEVRLYGAQTREALQLQDDQRGIAGALREELTGLFKDLPIRDIERKILTAQWELGSNFGTKDVIKAARSRLGAIQSRYGREQINDPSAGGIIGSITAGRMVPNPQYDPQIADTIRLFSEKLEVLESSADKPKHVVIVGDSRAKQYGGASPQGE